MDQPDGFNDERNTTKKCLLQKALYGTKQAARQLVGSLMYVAKCTRPYIAYGVDEVAMFYERY